MNFTLRIEEFHCIRKLFIKREEKEYYTPDTSKFADSNVQNYGKQAYNYFQRFKLYYFGRSKSHQDDIKVAEEKVWQNKILHIVLYVSKFPYLHTVEYCTGICICM